MSIALADDPAALVAQCEAYRLCFNAALNALHDAQIENARLARMVTDMREERDRYAREAFGRTPADD
jgi:hypothetical protein